MNSMFTLLRNAPHYIGPPARRAPASLDREIPRAIALDRWENEGGKVLPFSLQSTRAGAAHRAFRAHSA